MRHFRTDHCGTETFLHPLFLQIYVFFIFDIFSIATAALLVRRRDAEISE